MAYKLIALDLDGTLLTSKKEISPRTLSALMQAQEKGARIVLASGRPTHGITPMADRLRLNEFEGYLLAYNGGKITDYKTKEAVYQKTLEPSLLPYLYQCSKDNHLTIVTYHDEFVITENPDDPYVQKEAILNVMEFMHVPNFLEAIRFPINKCMIVGDPAILVRLEKEMQEALKDKMGVFRSEPYFLELVPKGIDKALSLDVLLKKLNLTSANLMACGDGYNDLSMIEFAGMGVAMANAQPIVKEHANFITLTNDEDGVAHAVDKFVLQENC